MTGAIALAWSEFPAATAAQLRWAFTYAHGGRRSTVTPPLLDAWAAYHVSETRHLDSQPTSTEPTFCPVTKTLLSAILKEGRLPFEVRVNTSETKGKAHDMPDFVLGDDKMFVGVYGEVKRANVLLEDLALNRMTKSGGISRVERAGFWFTGVRGGLFSASGSVPPDKRALQNPPTRKKCAMGTSSAASPW